MFKDARALDQERTAQSYDKALERYSAETEKWFDGSVGSIDRRLAVCDRLLHSARFTVARFCAASASQRYLQATQELESDRRALQALREDLLNGASGRADVTGLPGQRTANKVSTPPTVRLSGVDLRWVSLESAKFVAANADALDNPSELATRAASYAELKTSTFTPAHSHAVTRAFVARVTDLGHQSYVPTTVKTAAVTQDNIDPQAMFL